MRTYISILLMSFCIVVSGQNIKKGFKSLEKGEYDKAMDAFKKNLSEDVNSVGANFGLALVYADDHSPHFNIIDAWEYIERIEGKTDNLSQEDIEILSEYFLNTEVRKTSRPVKKKIAIAIEAIEARFIKYIREENNLEAVYEVLDRYPNFRHYDNVVHIRNQFEYRKYEKQGTRAAYEDFMKKFPDAAQIEKATRSRNRLAFEEVKAQNSVSAYTGYITQFPQSEYLQTAIKLRNAAAYSEAKRVNTLAAYENYITNYPDALEVSEAKSRQRELLYEQAKRIKSLQAFNDFINKYPDGQYFVDIFNLKATELGTLFLRENTLSSPALIWARGFDNNGRIESGGAMATTALGEYIVACNTRENDSAWADVWIVKLDADGKMQWNKTVGQAFEDKVSEVLIDSKGDIIVLGYTYLTADSASKMGWMFKLGKDGKKIWNRNLGKIAINSSAIDSEDRIYIGGSIERDSLGAYYSITTFNADAKKLNEKVYTGKGSVNDLIISPEGDIFICGSNWIMLMESKRYIKWDVVLDNSLTATSCSRCSNGDFYLAGYNDAKIFYARYGSAGNKIWLQDYPRSDSSQVIADIAATADNKLLVLEQTQDRSKMKLFAADGSVLGVKEFYGKTKLERTVSADTGTTVIMNDGNIIVVRYSQLNAL